MARRRSGLPKEIRSEISTRANAGVGLDPDFPTLGPTGTCTAKTACKFKPTVEMIEFVRTIAAHVQANDATHMRVMNDQDRNLPGALILAWSDGPSAADIANKFAVSHSECGTPRLPSWLALRVDNNFDLRWQPAF